MGRPYARYDVDGDGRAEVFGPVDSYGCGFVLGMTNGKNIQENSDGTVSMYNLATRRTLVAINGISHPEVEREFAVEDFDFDGFLEFRTIDIFQGYQKQWIRDYDLPIESRERVSS